VKVFKMASKGRQRVCATFKTVQKKNMPRATTASLVNGKLTKYQADNN